MSLSQVLLYALAAAALLTFLSLVVLVLTWAERKALARIQMRMGPMRVGFHGTLQPIADGIKLFTKEDILPSWADKRIYWIAPVAVFVPSLLLWVTLPVARDLVLRNLELGLFYITAISVLSVMGLIMAGWGSANKYAILGGLRAAGQLVSYEIPFIMAILGVAMLAQSLNLTDVVDGQANYGYAIIQPLGLFLFLTAGLAELGPHAVRHTPRRVRGRGGTVRRVQRRALGGFLPGGVSEHVHRGGADGSAVPGRLALARDAAGWAGALHAIGGVVHAQDRAGDMGHLLDTRHLSTPSDRPANVLRLEDAGAAVLPEHSCHRGRPVLRLAAVDAKRRVSAIIGGNGLYNLPTSPREERARDSYRVLGEQPSAIESEDRRGIWLLRKTE